MQTVIHDALDALMRLLTPILPFTMEEVYAHAKNAEEESVYHLNIEAYDGPEDAALAADFTRLLEIRDAVLKALEEARNEKTIGKSLEAALTLTVSTEDMQALGRIPALEKFFIVSSVSVKEGAFSTSVTPHPGAKCERCWHHAELNDEGLCARCVHVLEDLHGE
jgi:isoleucyl-tRNA synthetase